ncbi:integrase [Streptomyces sp. NPDC054863]
MADEMTHEELMGLPVAVSLDIANRALGMGRTFGYALARRDCYPVRVLRHGRQYRVTRYDLHRHLGVEAGPDAEGTTSS